MRCANILTIVLTVLITMKPTTAVRAAGFDEEHEKQVDRAVAAGIELEMTPGAVIVAGRADGVVFQKAYGKMTYDADAKSMNVDTVFDIASLSKVIGTATSTMILVDQRKMHVQDLVSQHISELRGEDKENITVRHLLLHRAGFVPDNPMRDFEDGPALALRRVYRAKLKYAPGEDYDYSDNSMIVLGKVVEFIANKRLDEFARDNIFQPLKMTRTTYNPPKEWRDNIAPTEKRDKDDKEWIIGEVHDPRAHVLNGVAGHAGVFSTGPDIARFCRMILRKGELDGTRILSEKTVAEMTKPRPFTNAKGEKTTRAYGFDVDTKPSIGPRGKVFTKGSSFGHTGYTGTSFWIDPKSDAFVIILTNRVHPDDDAEIKMFRKRIATIAGTALVKSESETAAGS